MTFTTKNSLADAQEAVADNLYWQTLGLKELRRKSPDTHQEAIASQEKDITDIKKSVSTVDAKIKRINRIAHITAYIRALTQSTAYSNECFS